MIINYKNTYEDIYEVNEYLNKTEFKRFVRSKLLLWFILPFTFISAFLTYRYEVTYDVENSLVIPIIVIGIGLFIFIKKQQKWEMRKAIEKLEKEDVFFLKELNLSITRERIVVTSEENKIVIDISKIKKVSKLKNQIVVFNENGGIYFIIPIASLNNNEEEIMNIFSYI